MALKTTSLISDQSVTASTLKTSNAGNAGDALTKDGSGNLVYKTLHDAQPTVTYKNANFTIVAGENVQIDTSNNQSINWLACQYTESLPTALQTQASFTSVEKQIWCVCPNLPLPIFC